MVVLLSSTPLTTVMTSILAVGEYSSHFCELPAGQGGNFLLEELVYGVDIAWWFEAARRLKEIVGRMQLSVMELQPLISFVFCLIINELLLGNPCALTILV